MNKMQRLEELFLKDAACHPDETAVVFDDGGSKKKASYRNLLEAVEEVKHILESLAVPGETIGILPRPTLGFPALILGILASKLSFMYVDYCNKWWLQNNQVVKKLNIRLYFQNESHVVAFPPGTMTKCKKKLTVLEEAFELIQVLDCKEGLKPDDSRIAYIMQTSGTTGEPKIVHVPHECIVPNIIHLRDLFGMKTTDTVFMASAPTFDPSIVDLFLALSSGATLLLVPEIYKSQPAVLVKILFENNRTSVIQATPSLMSRFGVDTISKQVLSKFSPLRVLALGGEKCPQKKILCQWKQTGNQTRIFNIYGITEVSCWATVNEIDLSKCDSEDDVCLGHPLLNTDVEVRDKCGRKLVTGEGVMFVGGTTRKCLVGDEKQSSFDRCMRDTGDIVKIENEQIFYVGRTDHTIKRFGKNVHLSMLESISHQLFDLKTCLACWCDKSCRLGLFIVPRKNGELKEDRLRETLLRHLPSELIPDKIIFLDILPVTKHGKVDRQQLKLLLIDDKPDISESVTLVAKEEIFTVVGSSWKKYLTTDIFPNEQDNFIISGGNSFLAVYLCGDIENKFGLKLNELTDKVLHKSFKEVCLYIFETCSACKRLAQMPEEIVEHKRQKITDKRVEDFMLQCYVCRGKRFSLQKDDVLIKKDINSPLHLAWKYDLGKCVDSSPLVIFLKNGSCRVVVGSHSHKVACIEINTGSEMWCVELGDRVESSPSVSPCGNWIFIGCYDHRLYCLSLDSGKVKWSFKTNGEIKSSPASIFSHQLKTTLVVFGAHDYFLYCVNGEDGQLIWKVKVSNGSIFSSPFVDVERGLVYAATLDGTCAAVFLESGKIKWTDRVGKPLFSSPAVLKDMVFYGCVDGSLYCYTIEGVVKWKFSASAPMFSSPCICEEFSSNQSFILFGCHDYYLYCVDQNGRLVWKRETSATIYAIPFLFSHLVNEKDKSSKWNVVVCCTDGTLGVYSVDNGDIRAQYKFPNEVFSSPVVYEDNLVVGCRDDNLYCLKL